MQPQPMPQWMIDVVSIGLTKLYSLSLENRPAAELIDTTALSWVEGFCHDREWIRDLDEPRFEAAFRALVSRVDRWPTPKQFLAAMPARGHVSLPRQRPADPEWLRRDMALVREAQAAGIPVPRPDLRSLAAGEKPENEDAE